MANAVCILAYNKNRHVALLCVLVLMANVYTMRQRLKGGAVKVKEEGKG